MVGDEVDRIIAAWHRERPDLDVAPLAVLSRITRLARLLDLARREAFTRHGLEPGQFDVLSALRRSGPPYELSPGQLMAETLVSSATMTHRIHRLEAAGQVTRRSNQADRRQTWVRLTPAGRAAVDAAMEELLRYERDILAALAPGAQGELADLLRRITAQVEQQRGPSGSTRAAQYEQPV